MEKQLKFLCGLFFSINFAVFWAVPVVVQGLLWKHAFKGVLIPLFNFFDNNSWLRKFAAEYIYNNPIHTDFFATSIMLIANTAVSVGFVFYWQLSRGYLPFWLIAAYYFAWVGIGGRIMGAAYALAHKEVLCLLFFLTYS
jgi:hypothetical protein